MAWNLLPDPPIRRIVTGHDATGKAVVLLDGPATNHKWSGHGNVSTLIWSTDQTPAEVWTHEDYGARVIDRQPPPRGSRFSITDFAPGGTGFMHRTDTVDYVVCLRGEIDMDMPGGKTVTMKAGDVMVQQGTDHSWINRGNETCRLAFVLLDALPHPVPGLMPVANSGDPKLVGSGTPPSPPIRRIVTTHRDGVPAILFDGPATNHKWSNGRGTVATLIWSTDRSPADIWSDFDHGSRILGNQPLPEGSRFSVNDYPPGTPGRMHRTDTVDYVICLKGTMRMDLDDFSVRMNAGDVMIQQATNHSWVNDGSETCRMVFVLLAGKPRSST